MLKPKRHARAIPLAIFTTLLMMGAVANAKDREYRVIHNFHGSSDGWGPLGVLAAAKNGDLYGGTRGGGSSDLGTVFKLTAPRTRGEAWRKTVLYNFTSGDPGYPTSLVMGKDGTLYGVGGGPVTCGFIFRMTPPVGGGSWHYEVLYTLNGGSDGCGIWGNLVLDAKGNLYGATGAGGDLSCNRGSGCGTVFELQRPTQKGGQWVFSVLYAFTGLPDAAEPFAGVTIDQKGNLYGTTNWGGTFGYGTVYRVSPPTEQGGPWTEAVLYSFDRGTNMGSNVEGPVTFDESGNMYGTTAFGGDLNCQGGYGCGVVFELTEAGGTWTYTNLYSFQGGSDGLVPSGYIVIDRKGNLYSTTQAGGGQSDAGIAFKLSPPSQNGDPWTETVLHRFNAPGGLGDYGGLIWGKWHRLYGVTYGGGTQQAGTVFELHP